MDYAKEYGYAIAYIELIEQALREGDVERAKVHINKAKERERKGRLNQLKERADNIELEGIYTDDSPKFTDAYIARATIWDRPATDEELELLNSDYDYVNELVHESLRD